MHSGKHHVHSEYPVDVYLSYAKSIGLAIQRRCLETPPRRPAEFWRICEAEIDVARWRMRNVTGQISQGKSTQPDV